MNDLWNAFLMKISEMTFMELVGTSMIIIGFFLLYCVGLFSEVS